MPRHPHLRLLAAATLAVAVTSCGGSGNGTPDASDTETTPTGSGPTKVVAPPRPPKTGECREVSFADISLYSNDTKTVSCDKPHTAFTFDVAELPDEVAFDGVEVKNASVQDAAAQACQSSYATFIGGDSAARALARLTVTYFVPEQKSFDAGAHWVRCDIVALQSENSLGDLPTNLEGLLDSADALTDFGVCSRGDPSVAGSLLVMCTQEHTYRAVTAFRLGDTGAAYPGEDEARDAGQQRCEDFIKDLLGVSGGFTYTWTYPSSANWDDGQRFGFCWNGDTPADDG